MKRAFLVILLLVPAFAQRPAGSGGAGGGSGGSGGGGTVTSVATGSCLKGGPITATGTIALDGAVNPQTSTYQLLASDFTACKTIAVSSGTFTITLVASASQPPSGQSISVINYGSGTVTIAPSGQLINGGSGNLTIGPGSAANPSGAGVKSDGTNYIAVVGSSFPAAACTNQFIRALAAGTAAVTCNTVGSADVTTALKTFLCEPGLGDGTNAIAAATYAQTNCINEFGSTFTITGIWCLTDNAGSSTLSATNGAGTALLTGAITCSNTLPGVAGTQSATVTIANGDGIKFTFVGDGSSKQTTWVVAGVR